MTTAYLLPQDCLPTSTERHNASFSDLHYGANISPGSRETFQLSNAVYGDRSRHGFNFNRRAVWTATAGSLTQPEHGRIDNSVQKDVDGKRMKARRPAEHRATMPSAPVFMILQRPKDKEVAHAVIEKLFVKRDEAECTTGLCDSKIEVKHKHSDSGGKNQFVKMKKCVPDVKMCVVDGVDEGLKGQASELDVPKLHIPTTKIDGLTLKDPKTDMGNRHNFNLSPSKTTSVVNDSSYIRFDELVSAKGLNQMLSPKGIGENSSPGRSNVMEIPHSDTKCFGGIMRTSSMSCPERWAGPAYSSSPAPSSLPLPRFSLPNQKMPSVNSSPLLMEGFERSSPQRSMSAPVQAFPSVQLGGGLDVASATRSLRRMLKLEPF